MQQPLVNPFVGTGLPDAEAMAVVPSVAVDAVAALLAKCPMHKETPLVSLPALATRAGVREVWCKDESQRMGLGSFKALGAAYVIAQDAANANAAHMTTALSGKTYVAASAGNHGLSIAAGAQVFGAQAVIFLAETVPEAFADRLRGFGARVERAGDIYEESMAAAEVAAADNGWTLLSDSSWPGNTEAARRVMEGYVQFAAEITQQIARPPTHVLLQAGVGGMAAAAAAYLRQAWGPEVQLIVVEPTAAPALHDSIAAGKLVDTQGPVSAMGRLDCKTPSMVALAGLSRDADQFCLLSEIDAQTGVTVLAEHDLPSTPSGAAGFAALLAGVEGIGTDARVLCILSEGSEDG
ncbi:MAG: pyridoxal-phosphate dependent enzyme [Thalassovita sp.]